MARRRIAFGGQSIRIPGAYSQVDARAMTPNVLGAFSRVGLIGSSVGGLRIVAEPTPGTFTSGPVVTTYSSPEVADRDIVGGDMLDGMKLLWAPSPETAGASEILTCRVDPATPSWLNLQNTALPAPADAVHLVARNFGKFTENIKVSVTDAVDGFGKKIEIWNALDEASVPEQNFSGLGKPFQLIRNDSDGAVNFQVIVENHDLPSASHRMIVKVDGVEELNFDFTNQLYNTVYKIVEYINNNISGTYSVRITGDAFTSRNLPSAYLDEKDYGVMATNLTVTAESYLPMVVSWVNSNSRLVAASLMAGATGQLANVVERGMTGGGNGTLTISEWEDAINKFEAEEVQLMVVLTDGAGDMLSVQLALKQHLEYMSTQGRSERRGYFGHPVGDAIDAVKERALSLSSKRTMLLSPGIAYKTDDNGDSEIVSSAFAACMACGMVAGSAPQEPLTNKQIAAIDIEKAYLDTEIIELLDSGVAPIRYDRTRGLFKIVQGQTTWLKDENTVYKEDSVGRISDFISLNVRRNLEDKFCGKAAETGTAEDIRIEVTSMLKNLLDAKIITNYRNVKVRIEGTIAYVDYEVAPSEPINFILITTRFVPSRLVA